MRRAAESTREHAQRSRTQSARLADEGRPWEGPAQSELAHSRLRREHGGLLFLHGFLTRIAGAEQRRLGNLDDRRHIAGAPAGVGLLWIDARP